VPVVSVKLWDVERIAKTKLPRNLEELKKLLAVFKAEVEALEEGELIYEAAHDRADTFSAEGLGRAIGIYLGTREYPKFKVEAPKRVKLDISKAPRYRPYAFGAVVRGLELDDEAIRQLFQLQEKLAISYGNRREIVSVGLYDLDVINPEWERGIVIEYKELKEGRMIPLGYSEEMTFGEVLKNTEKGKEYGHLVVEGSYPAFVYKEKVLSLAPILNAETYKVTEETKNVFVDVTGTVPEVMLRVLDVMVSSLAERGRDTVVEKVEVLGFGETPRFKEKAIKIDKYKMRELAGVDLDWEGELRRMGWRIEGDVAVAPPYRVDVFDVVDLVEDALSAHGYMNVPASALPPTHWGSRDRLHGLVADLMVGMGFEEVFNFTLIDKELVEELLGIEPVEIVNPRMKSYSAVRPSLVPSLLLSVRENQNYLSKIEIFEIGPVVVGGTTEWRLGVAVSKDKATLTDVGAVLMGLREALGLEVSLTKEDREPFVPGRSARIAVNGSEAGVMGEVHPKHLVRLGIRRPVAVLELKMDVLR